MKQDELLFHKFWPGLFCLFLFWLADVIGFFKLLLWHYPFMRFARWRGWKHKAARSEAFVYRYVKSKDQTACTSVFGGRSDETISNAAGRIWQHKGFSSPAWVVGIKWLTDRLDKPGHIQDSIEPVRDDYWTDTTGH
jgi:hypothetical protein